MAADTQSRRPATHLKQEGSVRASDDASSPRIAHTLTACCRCRTRKTRCDPGLPRCGPCERTNSHCEYYDATKGTRIPRNYVVYLQHKVRDLEKELADLEKDDLEPDPEDLMRGAAAVKLRESDETKFLGPSSGIAITRLVMQLAKQFTEAKSISEIVSDARARLIKEHFAQEEAKPTSKVYPLISDVAADELPNRDLTNLLVQLFYAKVQPMYPIFHEPTFVQDVEDVYNGDPNPCKNFCLRMVIAISLQKMDTQYAGLADSYYLAALKYLEPSIRPMDIHTLQCFALIAGYSLLTPTRTAIYYIIGIAVRLAQSLGLNEEKTITRGRGGQPIDPLELDLRRRIFWIILTMDYGLAHSLGRPSIMATSQEHIDVNFFHLVDDQYITREGILPAPGASLKKWICIHFFRMRMLQLEIRKKLYMNKRPEPKNDQHPWFEQMEAKMIAWRDASPEGETGSGLDKVWFVGRCNTMIIFLLRPSPQVPRPSVRAAIKCYNACTFNIHMHLKQIQTRSVDLTWIFTQALFMAINTLLWTLSYSEVRSNHSREEVQAHLGVALEAVQLASSRWPGVISAIELYRNLIDACLKVYDKDGDIPIAAGSPSESASVTSASIIDGVNRSRTTSPASVSTSSLATPSEKSSAPFGYISPTHSINFSNHATTTAYQGSPSMPATSSPIHQALHHSPHVRPIQRPISQDQDYPSPNPNAHYFGFDRGSQFNPLPSTFSELSSWNPSFSMPGKMQYGMPTTSAPFRNPTSSYAESPPHPTMNGLPLAEYLSQPGWSMERNGAGLDYEQHSELMETLVTTGTGQIETMIEQSNAIFSPRIKTF